MSEGLPAVEQFIDLLLGALHKAWFRSYLFAVHYLYIFSLYKQFSGLSQKLKSLFELNAHKRITIVLYASWVPLNL